MKTTKIITLGLAISLFIGMVTYAASPAQIYSELTGVSVEKAYELRNDGKTYGELASEQGVLEEFKAKMIEEKIIIIEEKVQEGELTREEADEFIQRLKDNSENCDPTNPNRLGQKIGLGRGSNRGQGRGRSQGGCGMRYNGNRGLGLGRK
ncbi:MAG: hypothetical protein N4A50_08565 [Vallitalea sp.]|jgi:hypothetical protein|nr:hypothetical protein [Vallitalea sp.]